MNFLFIICSVEIKKIKLKIIQTEKKIRGGDRFTSDVPDFKETPLFRDYVKF